MAHMAQKLKKVERIPFAPLGIICLESSRELGNLVNNYIVNWRKEERDSSYEDYLYPGYIRNSYLTAFDCLRFGTGEGKAVINESIRGYDIYIIVDVGNYSCKFKMYGMDCPMSPDDHFQDLKRVISALGGKARRISVIMPLLYEGRQHRRITRESLDCALALQDLDRLGVDNILTFDAHDPKIQNAIPLKGFENIYPTYQIIKALLKSEGDLVIDRSKMVIISPDEGGIGRNLYYSTMLGLDLGMFYKRRDYSKVVGGRNPILAHEFLGESIEGKDVLIVDDMLATGESILDIAEELKRRKAGRIYVAVTFGQFTEGIAKFQKAYEEGLITKVLSTNLTYRKEELKQSPWYIEVDMSKFIAYLIDTLNHDQSISSLLNPADKISNLLKNYREKQ